MQDTQEQTSTPPPPPPPPNALMRRFNAGIYELDGFVVPDDAPIVFDLTNVEGSDARRSRSSQGQSRSRRRPSELNERRVRQRLRQSRIVPPLDLTNDEGGDARSYQGQGYSHRRPSGLTERIRRRLRRSGEQRLGDRTLAQNFAHFAANDD